MPRLQHPGDHQLPAGPLMERAAEPDPLTTRTAPLRLRATGSGPATLDESSRSVEVTLATEAPVRVYDWESGRMTDEVLLMDGVRLPASGQVPLLDSHYRYSTTGQLGSLRDLRVEGGVLVARAHFADTPDAARVLSLIRDGHLTDVSVGYSVEARTRVKERETYTLNGKSFTGPVTLSTAWTVREGSVTPIGADQTAKIRAAARQQEGDSMSFLLNSAAGAARQAPPADPAGTVHGSPVPEAEAGTRSVTQADPADVQTRAANPATAPAPAPAAPAVTMAPPTASPTAADAARAIEALTVTAQVQAALTAERQRSEDIAGLCRTFACEDLAPGLLRSGASLDAARAAVLDHLAKRGGATEALRYAPTIEVGREEGEKYRAAAVDGLLLRSGRRVDKPAPGASELRHLTMRELAREHLVRSGERPPADPMLMVGRAFSSSDFPVLLSTAVNQVLLAEYQAAEETFPQWTDTGSLPDFRPLNMSRAGEFDDLDELPEGAEYKYGTFGESNEIAKLGTYGKAFKITRQAIVNDNLAIFSDVPQKMARASARLIGNLAVGVLVANAKMGDNVALFHATHGNLAGSGAVIGAASLDAAATAMKGQKDLAGKRTLNIRPAILLAPSGLEGPAEQFFNTTQTMRTPAPDVWETVGNRWSGAALTRIYEPRLDDDDAHQWYLLARPGLTVRLYYLNGQQAPYLELQSDSDTDGLKYKVRIDAVAKALDYRGIYCNPGA